MPTANNPASPGGFPTAGSPYPVNFDPIQPTYDPVVGPAVAALQQAVGIYTGPTGLTNVFAQSIPDELASSTLASTAGTVFATLVGFRAGVKINNISMLCYTASSTPTNQWAGIASFATTAKVLAISADGTTTADAIDTVLTYACAYTIPTSGLYYVFHMFAGTTGPALSAAPTLGTHGRGNIAPFTSGPCATGQTTPLAVASTFTQPTAASAIPLYYIN